MTYLLWIVTFLVFSEVESACKIVNSTDAFVHPGILHTEDDFAFVREKIQAGASPWLSGWNKLVANSHSSLTYSANPKAAVYRGYDGNVSHAENYGSMMNDAAAAYQLAIRWKLSGDNRYAKRCAYVLDAWSTTLQIVSGNNDQYLLMGLQGFQFATAGEILLGYSGWNSTAQSKFKNMMLTLFYPGNKRFLKEHVNLSPVLIYANWDLCTIASIMAIGVLTDRRDIFDEGLTYFMSGVGNGMIERTIWKIYDDGTGQLQESGRDQGHATLVVALLGQICQTAYNQGCDMWEYQDNRVLKGAEYTAKYNLGENVNYTTYQNQDVTQTVISAVGRGTMRPNWELIYNHYENVKGIPAPWSRKFAETVRPEGGGGDYGPNSGGFDQLGFGTLMFSRDPYNRPTSKRLTTTPTSSSSPSALSPSTTASSAATAPSSSSTLSTSPTPSSTTSSTPSALLTLATTRSSSAPSSRTQSTVTPSTPSHALSSFGPTTSPTNSTGAKSYGKSSSSAPSASGPASSFLVSASSTLAATASPTTSRSNSTSSPGSPSFGSASSSSGPASSNSSSIGLTSPTSMSSTVSSRTTRRAATSKANTSTQFQTNSQNFQFRIFSFRSRAFFTGLSHDLPKVFAVSSDLRSTTLLNRSLSKANPIGGTFTAWRVRLVVDHPFLTDAGSEEARLSTILRSELEVDPERIALIAVKNDSNATSVSFVILPQVFADDLEGSDIALLFRGRMQNSTDPIRSSESILIYAHKPPVPVVIEPVLVRLCSEYVIVPDLITKCEESSSESMMSQVFDMVSTKTTPVTIGGFILFSAVAVALCISGRRLLEKRHAQMNKHMQNSINMGPTTAPFENASSYFGTGLPITVSVNHNDGSRPSNVQGLTERNSALFWSTPFNDPSTGRPFDNVPSL